VLVAWSTVCSGDGVVYVVPLSWFRWSLSATIGAVLLVTGCSVYDAELLPPNGVADARAVVGASVVVGPSAAVGAGAVVAAGSGAPVDNTVTLAAPAIEQPDVTFSTKRDTSELAACADPAALQYCSQLPRLRGTHFIDAERECGLGLETVSPSGWSGSGTVPDIQVAYAAAWSSQGLYVYVEVHGQRATPHSNAEPVFCGDAIEIYVDSDAQGDDAGTYDPSGTMQFVVAAPLEETTLPDAARFIQGRPAGPWISTLLRVKPLVDGYAVEAVVTASDLGLWQWAPAERLGFSLAIDVAGTARAATAAAPAVANEAPEPCSARLGQLFLKREDTEDPCRGEPWCDARAFCTPVLSP